MLYLDEKKELFKKLVAQSSHLNNDAQADYLAAEFDKIDKIKRAMRGFALQEGEEIARHEKAMENIDLERKKVQKECNHHSVTFHGDPSGNNDSFYECNICDSQSKRGFKEKSNGSA